jgi:hypothetical protein
MTKAKPFDIPKREVWEAFKKVKANQGAAGVHTGTTELAVPEFRIDADLTIDPSLLRDAPEIDSAMRAAGFERGNRVGAWVMQREIAGASFRVEVGKTSWPRKGGRTQGAWS